MSDLFLKVVNMSLSATWLVLAVIAARLLLKKAPKAINVLLWGLVALRLICPFTIESRFSQIPEGISSGEVLNEWADDYVGDIEILHDNLTEYDTAVASGRTPIPAGEGSYYVVTAPDKVSEPSTVGNTVIPVLAWVWLAGIAVLLVYSLISYLRLRHRVHMAIRVTDNIYLSEFVSSPFVLGFFRPHIYLPYHMEELDRHYVIAHERTHIARKDHWWKPLGFGLLALHWFNPAIWVAYILLCRDIELACDEQVVMHLLPEQRADYSEALLNCSIDRRSIAACPLAFGEVGVKERVKNVLSYKKPGFWIVLIALILCLVVAVCFLTDPAEETSLPIPRQTYAAGEVLFDDPRLSSTWWYGTDTPYCSVSDDGHLYTKDVFSTDTAMYDRGALEVVELTYDNFDRYFWGEYNARSIRWNNAQAWRVILPGEEKPSLYYLLRQKNGELYLACGTYDPESESDSASDDSSIRWLLRLQAVAPDDWNVTMTIESLTPTGATILFDQYLTRGDYVLFGGSDYVLQTQVDGEWTDLPTLEEPVFTTEAYELTNMRRHAIDWEWLYGTLSPGHYRIGKGVTLWPNNGEERQYATVYAEFDIGVSLAEYLAGFTSENLYGSAEFASGGGYNFFPEEEEELFAILSVLSEDALIAAPGVTAQTIISLGQDDREISLLFDGETVELNFGGSSCAVQDPSLNAFFDRINQNSPYENSTYEIYNVAPLEELTDRYNLEEAAIDKVVILIDGDVSDNQEVWADFISAVGQGEAATVRVMHYTHASSAEDSPAKTIMDLSYDGSSYTLRYFENGEEILKIYPYLRYFEGEKELAIAEYDSYKRYILTDNNVASYDTLWKTQASSASGYGADYFTIYSDLIYSPKSPEVPALKAVSLRLDGEELLSRTDAETVHTIGAMFASAEATYEPKTYSLGPELVLIGENGTEMAVKLSLDSDLCRIEGTFYDYGPGYDDVGAIDALPLLWYVLGITEWPNAVYEKYADYYGQSSAVTETPSGEDTMDYLEKLLAYAAAEDVDAFASFMPHMDWALYGNTFGNDAVAHAMELLYVWATEEDMLDMAKTKSIMYYTNHLDGAYAERFGLLLSDLYDKDNRTFALTVFSLMDEQTELILELFAHDQNITVADARGLLEGLAQ